VGDNDYVSASGVLTFNPGETSKRIGVTVNGDNKYETDETFNVNLSGAVNATIADGLGVGTILNDDAMPQISISDTSAYEGNTGTKSFGFYVTLSNPSGATVTVNYSTSDGTATVGDNDYVSASGVLTFNPGETSKRIGVTVNGDNKYETDETFNVNLSAASGATISDGLGIGTILNDDPVPSIVISDTSAYEGNAGTTSFGFYVTLSNPSYQTVTVNYSTSDGTATVADNDYTATSGILTFNPGELVKRIGVDVIGDNKYEIDETFNVNLSSASGATISDGLGIGTILNDDPMPQISISDTSAYEGNAGTTSFGFYVILSNPSGATVTVNYSTSDGTATVVDNDYVSASGVLTFNPGETSKRIGIDVIGDNKYEIDETFNVNLSSASGATISDGLGIGTILNDDPMPQISINDTSATEGNVGTKSFMFNVTLSNPSYQTITVNYATSDGSATLSDNDYLSASGVVSFAPGVTSQWISVSVNGDFKYETDETFNVNLSEPTNASIADGLGIGTILNDDEQPSISINDVSLAEGNSGTTAFVFTLSLSNLSYQTITVDYSTADNTATVANNDYIPSSGTVTFNPDEGSKQITVQVVGDNDYELDETFFVNLTNAVNATIADNQGIGTILNDDEPPAITISDTTDYEGNAGTKSFGFYVTLSVSSYLPVTVNYTTANGTATTGDNDYIASSGTLTFAPGEQVKRIGVDVVGDNKYETDEIFYVNLSGAVNATIADGVGEGTILNDDVIPTMTISDTSATEDNIGTKSFGFYVTLSNPSYQTITVNYATANGTATTGDNDYIATSGTLTFNPGEVVKRIGVDVIGDNKYETDETFYVNLTNLVNATFDDDQAIGTILNDDDMPTMSINDVSHYEGNAGTTAYVFTVSLSNPSYQTITVDYSTADNTATIADNDYTAESGSLTFSSGDVAKTITVYVNGDNKYELDETFYVNLTNLTNATFEDNQGLGTILNDDPIPTISITDVTDTEGDYGTKPFIFVVTLSNPSYQVVTVDFATADGTANTPDDYIANSGVITFAPGDVYEEIVVDVVCDRIFESDEYFYVNLSNPVNAGFGDDQGLGTILNDDPYHDVEVKSILVPGTTVVTCTPITPEILVGNNRIPAGRETCTLTVKMWRYRVQYDSVCHISMNPLDSVILIDTMFEINIPYGDTIITLAPWHPIWGDIFWISSPTYHVIYANVHMELDHNPANDTKQKNFTVQSRDRDLQVNYAGLLLGKTLVVDTILTGTSYNTFSVVSNSPFGPTVGFRSWFKVIKVNTGITVYSRYLDRTLAPASYVCLYYQSGWVPTEEGLYKIVSWIETRPGYDLVAENNLIERYYYAKRPMGENVQGTPSGMPTTFALLQNYPNPFANITQIRWQIPRESRVTISVYDATGRIVKTLVNDRFNAGYYSTLWNGTDNNNRKVASGIYFYEMQADNYTARYKMVVTH
ncbi:MAG: Calx-beta domain-containing protein, partial [candidate division WOR-3 bacterium]